MEFGHNGRRRSYGGDEVCGGCSLAKAPRSPEFRVAKIENEARSERDRESVSKLSELKWFISAGEEPTRL